jgi:hypothetical protein
MKGNAMTRLSWLQWSKQNRKLADGKTEGVAGPGARRSGFSGCRIGFSSPPWSGDIYDGLNGATGPLWNPSDGVERILGSVHVPSGKTLTIERGTVIQFSGGLSLVVDGTADRCGWDMPCRAPAFGLHPRGLVPRWYRRATHARGVGPCCVARSATPGPAPESAGESKPAGRLRLLQMATGTPAEPDG